VLLRSAPLKAAHKTLVKLTPEGGERNLVIMFSKTQQQQQITSPEIGIEGKKTFFLNKSMYF